MHAAADRPEFAPPPQPGLVRAFVLAVIAHLLLLLALMHGLQWQRESENGAAEAELWSALPQVAAPKPVEAPPPPPQPVVKAAPAPEPPVQRDADIALEREKRKRELEKQRQAELDKREREERRKLEAQKKREEELAKKKQEQAKVAEAKREDEEKKRKQQELEAARLAKQREENLDRIRKQAAGTGPSGSSATAAQSSGPSASWGARVQARVRPNIVFSDNVPGNPEAVVEVRLAPDGAIVSRRIKKSSGHKGWDEAVLRALDKTEVLPRDTDGRVPTAGDLVFRPKT